MDKVKIITFLLVIILLTLWHPISNAVNAWHITIVGEKNNLTAKNLYDAASKYIPLGANVEWLNKNDKSYPVLKKPAAYICINNGCSLPVFEPKKLAPVIIQLGVHNNSIILTSPETTKQENISKYINTNKLFLDTHKVTWIIFIFWASGLLLSFTPCVLPLIIIIASFLSEQKGINTKFKAISLSVTYVLALAGTYAISGMITAYFGIYLQAYFQQPAILATFSIVFVLLGLSMLGLYTIKLPQKWQRQIIKQNKYREYYTYIQVIVMGILATLIAAPCAAAPLIGVLSYVAGAGSIKIGGLALFFLGLGIGTPLILVTTLSTNFLPKTYAWQIWIKTFFGLLMLGVAITLVKNIIPPSLTMIFWSALIIYTAIYMQISSKNQVGNLWILYKTIALMVLIFGIVIFVGEIMGNTNPLSPLELHDAPEPETLVNEITFIPINNLAELQNAFLIAKTQHKPILMDFTANWCISCAELKLIFEDVKVKALLKQFVLVSIDLSYMNNDVIHVAEKFKVTAPPVALFFDKNGKEINARVYADINALKLAELLQLILENKI